MTDQAQPISDTDLLEAEVAAVIEDFRGDARAAIKALLVEQEILEQRIGRLAHSAIVRLTSADRQAPSVQEFRTFMTHSALPAIDRNTNETQNSHPAAA